MKASAILSLIGLAALSSASTNYLQNRDHDKNDYYVLHIDSDTNPDQVALRLGLTHEGQLGELKDHHIFSSDKSPHDIVKREIVERKRRKRNLNDRDILDAVRFSDKQVLRKPWEKRVAPRYMGPNRPRQLVADKKALAQLDETATKLKIADPIFKEQWHLFNPVQLGHDINVKDVWLGGVTGKNTTVAIVDDGLDMYSDDLKANYYAEGSWDFNDKVNEPKPRLDDDRHGTRCAGEVSAVRNDICGVGVAYDSKIAGLRILSKAITDADEALAMNYDFQHNDIYSCSWGPPDDGMSMEAPGILITKAMVNGVQNGRGGLGSIYVFASGNGASAGDDCNFDGYTNSIYSITVGAIDREGGHPYYSEKCSASLVVTYSSGAGDAIHTTDVGANQCYTGHGGTSAAAPLAAGIFALALEANHKLSWRDMQALVVETAVPINLDTGEWQKTFIGKQYSHTFAYGKLDSFALVEKAKTWKSLKPQAWFYTPWMHINKPIPQGEHGLVSEFEITADMLKEANFEKIEQVTVTMNVAHTRRGDLSVDLISPNNIVSHISAVRSRDNKKAGYVDWTFMSVIHWGESGLGKWQIIIRDNVENEHNGTLTDWHLKLFGESIDPAKAKLLPMPDEHDDDNHDKIETISATATATSLGPGAPKPTLSDNPSDHPDRPTKPTKPATVEPAPATSTSAVTSTSSAPSETTTNSSWLPSFLKNLSTKTQAWIYGAIGLIIVFCAGLGIYLFMARRKRLRNNPRDDYEFELLDEEEAEGLNTGEKNVGVAGAPGKKNRRTRGGELYDAFAGGSEDEDADEYRDRSPGDSDMARREKRGGGEEEDEEHHVIGGESDDEESGREDERRQDGSLLGRR